MAEGFVHTVHADGSWRNTIEGAAPLPGTYAIKEEAVEAGRAHAMQRETEHLIAGDRWGTLSMLAAEGAAGNEA